MENIPADPVINPLAQLPHLEHVRLLALALFDRTRPLHGLADDSRHTLEAAALLIDQALPQKKKKPSKKVRWIIEALAAQELSDQEKKVMAAVVALYQHQVKKKDLHRFDLAPVQQRESLTLTALLRIAAGLDHSRTNSTLIHSIEPTRDGMWIIVEGPHALSDAQAAQPCTRLWAQIGYPKVTIMETSEAAQKLLPYPSPDETLMIIPGEPLVEAARKVMRYHFAQMLKHEPGTRLGEDIEALHDMRVATRRMRAAFEVFKDAFEPGALKPYLKGLRATGRTLGAVRDLDVFIEKADRYLQSLSDQRQEDLSPVMQAWQSQREQARIEMTRFLDSPEYAIFKREFNTFLLTPGAGALQLPVEQAVPGRVCELAPVLIYTRLGSVMAFDPLPPDAPLERLHALRIEFKKLRYTVEYFHQVLGPRANKIIEELKQLQDHLGDLNDANVATNLLDQLVANAEDYSIDAEHLEFIRHYQDYCAAERARLYAAFPQAWKHFKRREFRQNLAKAVSAL